MFYKYIISAAVLVSPWLFTLPAGWDWTKQAKEKAVIGILVFLVVYGIWFYNKCYAFLLAYLDVFSAFRDNDVSFPALIVALAFSCLYLVIQWIQGDLTWLKKAVALSFALVLGYGVLQFFYIDPIISAVNAAIKFEGGIYAENLAGELTKSDSLKEGVYVVQGKDYLKGIVYRKSGDGLAADLEIELPTIIPHLRVSGMFGNPNDWMAYVFAAFPFACFFVRGKRALVAAGVMIAIFSVSVYLKYYGTEHVSKENSLSKSIEIRLTIYGEIFDQYTERWLFGHGLGTFKIKFPERQKLKDFGAFVYAHNDFLQFLYETGIVGFFLLIGTIAVPLANIKPVDKEKSILLGSLLLFGLAAMISFPAHIAPTALVGMIAFALLSKTSHPRVAFPFAQ